MLVEGTRIAAVGPLTDAALTSYHAIKRSLHLLGPGSVAVLGDGSVTTAVVTALVASGATESTATTMLFAASAVLAIHVVTKK